MRAPPSGWITTIPAIKKGTGRLLSLLLGVITAAERIVLIDEIENGIHYSALVDVWKALAQSARVADVQIVATTHSWECIVAAQRAFADAVDDDFRLHRMDRGADGRIRAFSLGREALATAVRMGMEVR
jgi:predicted ATPase